MTLSFIRVLFLIMSGVVGYSVGTSFFEPLLGAEIGCLCGLVFIFIETQMRQVSVRGLSSVVFGLLLGVFMAKLISDVLLLAPLGVFFHSVSRVVLTIIFSYLGAVMALRGKDEFNIIIPYVRFRRQDTLDRVILLDTSVIIDGRVAELFKINFMPGRLVVTRSVLQELQKLADSSDDLKRQRGRRGFELLKGMQADSKVDISIHEDELKPNQPVDEKLLDLAKVMEAGICTNDYNLTEVGELQGIEMLNIQELVRTVKSVIFTGEELEVKLIKKGKESGQAVGYTEDGTMIVVSNAEDSVGQEKQVRVSSVLQTQSGKIIFADPVEA